MLDNDGFAPNRSESINSKQVMNISSQSFDCFTQQEESLPGWQQEYVQLTPESFQGRVTRVDFGGLSLFRETVNQATINRFAFPEGHAFLSVSLRSSAQALAATGRLGAQEAFLSHFSGEGECLNTGPVDFVGVTFAPDSDLAEETHRWTRLGAGAGPLGDWLAAMIGSFAGGHASADLQNLAPMLIADRLSLYLETRGQALPPARAGGVKMAADALALLRALPVEDLSVKTLSRYLNHAPATLRATYRAHFDADLDGALVALRLSSVRRRLQAGGVGDVTVSSVAADHGFLHWGRFAAAYRGMFGELPVETLRRAPQGRSDH